jgi:hypothetical protein
MNMNLINACIFAVVLGVSAIAIAADVVVVDEKDIPERNVFFDCDVSPPADASADLANAYFRVTPEQVYYSMWPRGPMLVAYDHRFYEDSWSALFQTGSIAFLVSLQKVEQTDSMITWEVTFVPFKSVEDMLNRGKPVGPTFYGRCISL